MPLTPTDLAILDLERTRWKHAGAKDAVIMDWFGWTATRYYQVLNALLDRPEAEAVAPTLIHRLRRLRDVRRRARQAPAGAQAVHPGVRG